MIVICDIDGTVADLTHRLHHIKDGKKNWDAFHDECDKDVLIEPIHELVTSLSTAEHATIFVTGRMEHTRVKTQAWLAKHGFGFIELYMRKEKDYRPDFEIKKEILDEIVSVYGRDEILLAIDDRNQVVKMWRENGITCLQVKDGDY